MAMISVRSVARLAPVATRALGSFTNPKVKAIWDKVVKRDGNQKEFLQAVDEVMTTMEPVFAKNPKYIEVMERLIEPERAIQFRVAWLDDKGKTQVNRGFRVQYNSAIGPYKGGLRLHPSVNLSIIKFLGFEQIFKNSLTTLPMGGGKGGSDFNPKGKSEAEVMRFCQSFMTELYRHIGANIDVPAGDIGVGGREIGYLFGQYKRLTKSFEGVLTGKNLRWGGSLIRPQATGYGTCYFAENMLQANGTSMSGKRVCVSGSGNVAQYAIEKCLDLGGTPLTCSDSNGYILMENGWTREDLAKLMHLKNVQRKRLSEFPKVCPNAKYVAGKRPWEVPCEIALPCATQNEIEIADAKMLVENGVKGVFEGANMPSTTEAITHFHENKVMFGPAKAANAGGVAVSGLEMSQNSLRLSWTSQEVDDRLKGIMKAIYQQCEDAAKAYKTTIQAGANIAGFLKVADSMIEQGCV